MNFIKSQLGIYIFLLLMLSSSIAQESKVIKIPLNTKNWKFKPESVEFLEYKSEEAMKLNSGSDIVVLKDFNFTNGTIEFDMEPLVPGFTSIYFRWENALENEIFYFRTWKAGDPQAMEITQYAPTVRGVNMWDMLFHYQANADFKNNDWNHVKLVISGKQMRAYVNDMTYPVMCVPMLEGNTSSGTLAFDGKVVISNLLVKHNKVEELKPEPGIDPTSNDTRYLRMWKVSKPIITDEGIDFRNEYYPNDSTKWETISAEQRGLINLSRNFGQSENRRIVWLRTTIFSEKEQGKLLRFGFSDEVWVLINNAPLYIDKNLYNTPMAKQPNGRCSIENTSITIPLKKGENQLLIGVSNFFYGWGIVARFDDLNDIRLDR